MRASPRLTQFPQQVPFLRAAKDAINPLSLLSSSTQQFSLCWKQRLRTCGFLTAAEARFRLRVYSALPPCIRRNYRRQNSLPFLLKGHLSQAVCLIGTSAALSCASISTSSKLQERPRVCAKPIKESNKSSQGVQPAIKGAKKGKNLRSRTGGHSDEQKCEHGVRESGEKDFGTTSTGELHVSKSNAFVSTVQPAIKGARKGKDLRSRTEGRSDEQKCEHGVRESGEEDFGTASTGELHVSNSNAFVSTVQPAIKGARKGKDLQSRTGGRSDEQKCEHGVRESGEEDFGTASTGELRVSKSNAFVSTCEPNGENRVTQQNCETSIENEKVVLIPSQACEEKEAIDNDAVLKNGRVSRRFKKKPEAAVILLKLNMCSKLANLHGALEIYDHVKREGLVHMSIYNYNVLLYICSGAAAGSLAKGARPKKEDKKPETTTLQTIQHDDTVFESLAGPKDSDSLEENKELVHFSSEDMELAATRGAEILEDMLQQGVEPNEATFTSIVRLAVAKNDGDLAFETIKLMASSGIPPKLRSYAPPLLCFCESNKADKAFEVDDHMRALGVLPDESMLDSLLRVSIEAGLEDKVYTLLQRLRILVRDLLPTTVKTIERWFNSEAAASAGKAKWENLPSEEELRQATEASGGGWHGMGWLGKGAWQVKRTSIGKTGSCLFCGEKLCTIDLDPKDTEDFASCIAELACQREQQPNGFKAFQKWLDVHGPFDAIVDGANVALYNPKVYRGFNFMLLNAVVRATRAKISPQRPPLVLLHSRHGPRIVRTPADEQVLNKWRKENALFFTPQGSNDDWFWLYAAVKCKCMLITNDEMRDHLFELLGNDFFPKWKERHQVRFTFTAKELEVHMPPPYSIVIQESQNGSWHVPQTGGDDIEVPRKWLCVTRADTAFS